MPENPPAAENPPPETPSPEYAPPKTTRAKNPPAKLPSPNPPPRDQPDPDDNAIFQEDGPLNPTFMAEAIRTLMRTLPLNDHEPPAWSYRRMFSAARALAALHPRDEIEVMLGVQAIAAYHAAAACWRIGMNLRQPNGDSTRHITTAASAARTFDTLLKALERRQAKPLATPPGRPAPRQWPKDDPVAFVAALENRCSDTEDKPSPNAPNWTRDAIDHASKIAQVMRLEDENAGLDIANTEGILPGGGMIVPENPTPQQQVYIGRRIALRLKRERAENLPPRQQQDPRHSTPAPRRPHRMTAQPPRPHPAPTRKGPLVTDPRQPQGPLMQVILGLLTPLLAAGHPDTDLARRAAEEAIAACGQGPLLTAAQAVAFALAALDNLRLSAAADLAPSTKLRLRSNATGLARAARNAATTMRQPEQHPAEAELESAATPDPAPATQEPVPATLPIEQRIDRHWANAMAQAAADLKARATLVAPAQRRTDRLWADVLSNVAADLRLPTRKDR